MEKAAGRISISVYCLPPRVSKGRLKKIKAVWKTKINQGGFIFFFKRPFKGFTA